MSGRGGTGRRWGLKILCHWRAGSSPAVRTSLARGLCAALIVTSTTSCGRRPDVGPVVASVIGGEPDLAARRRGDLSTPDRVLTDALAEGLVRFDATGQIEPGIAERWIVTDNGMSYIFRLRDARWADGTPVRAAEVVALLRRQITLASDNRLAPFLTAVASVVEMTPEVIEIELSRPRPDLLKLFAQPEMGLVRSARAGGAGPFRRREQRGPALVLTPAADPDRDPAEAVPTPEDEVMLHGERASRAILRFVGRDSDLVLGGTLDDWPIMQAGNPAPANIRFDPAAGLFGLAVVRRDGLLASEAGRAAIAQAIDRADLSSFLPPDWAGRETVLPEQFDSATPPAPPPWAALTREQRVAAARASVASWHALKGVPTLGIALPDGPGGTLLWGRLARDLYAVGIRPRRLGWDDTTADLRLIDQIAPYDSARWYLVTACVACSDDASAAIEASRLAGTLPERAQRLATADAALAADGAFITLGRPLRWSLVSLRLRQWQPNTRAWHPLNRLRGDPS